MRTNFEARTVPPCAQVPARGLTYRNIAWWAETADGLPDQELALAEVEEKGSIKHVIEPAAVATSKGHKVLIRGIFVDSCQPGRPKVDRVVIEVDGVERECKVDGQTCDAVFCTESAVRKFLLPYYHAQRLLSPEDWEDLNTAIADPTVPAIGHVAPSHSRAVGGSQIFSVAQAKVNREGQVGELEWISLREYSRRLTVQAAAR